MDWKDYKNLYVGQAATVVGKGRTDYDYPRLGELSGPVVFINESVQLGKHLKDQPRFHFFLDLGQAKLAGKDGCVCVLPRELAGYVGGSGHLVYQSVEELPLDGREGLATNPRLLRRRGTMTPVLHFLWYLGIREVRFIGCDGAKHGEASSSPRWVYNEVCKVQDQLVELFGFQTTYLGTIVEGFKISPDVRIGIGVTTHNRPEMVKKVVEHIRLYTKECQYKLVVVDDGSDEGLGDLGCEVVRHEVVQGIARAKNRCLEELEGTDYVFLFDDDCYPVQENWWRPYVEAAVETGEQHFALQWSSEGNRLTPLRSDPRIETCTNGCGCMLFVTRKVLDVVGGMDTIYGRWGCEHTGWSYRIRNAGLGSHPFMGLRGSGKWFFAFDRDAMSQVKRTVSSAERHACFTRNRILLEKEKTQKHWKPYRTAPLVVGCMLTGFRDPQRPGARPVEQSDLLPWAQSILAHKREAVLLTNDIKRFQSLPCRLVEVKTNQRNPYVARMHLFLSYLRSVERMVPYVFLTDVGDVLMMSDPFPCLEERLYMGDELGLIGNSDWMKRQVAGFKDLEAWIAANGDKVILNMGLIGGKTSLVIEFLDRVCKYFDANVRKIGNQILEMPVGNMVGYEMGAVHGTPVNTRFKGNEMSTAAWWKHK